MADERMRGWTRGRTGRFLRGVEDASVELPTLCLELIFSFLDRRADAISAGATCHAWHRASLTAPAWRKVEVCEPDVLYGKRRGLRLSIAMQKGFIRLPSYPPAREAAFVAFLIPRALVIRRLCIHRTEPLTNLGGTRRRGISSDDELLAFLSASANLEHLDIRTTWREADFEKRIPTLVEAALRSCPRLTSLKLPNWQLLKFEPSLLSRVETLWIDQTNYRYNEALENELVCRSFSHLSSLKNLTLDSMHQSYSIRSTSLQKLTVRKGTQCEELECPNLQEFIAEEFWYAEHVRDMWSKLPRQLQMQTMLSESELLDLWEEDRQLHLVASGNSNMPCILQRSSYHQRQSR